MSDQPSGHAGHAGHGRRDALRFAAGLPALGSMALLADAAGRPARAAWLDDPSQKLRGHMRMQGDLSGGVTPWLWQGYYVATKPDRNPETLFFCQGCESKKIIDRGNDQYEVWSKVMTIFQDPESREVLNGKQWQNPYTGETVTIAPNIIGSRSIYTLDDDGQIVSQRLDDGENPWGVEDWTTDARAEPLLIEYAEVGPYTLARGRRKYPEVRPIPLAEYGTSFYKTAEIAEPDPPRVDGTFCATFLAPWQAFLGMPKEPGHATWHCAGVKLYGFGDLPPEYLEQAKIHIPDVLAWEDAE